MEEVRANIIAYFGLDGASVTGLTLSELVVNVTNLAHGKANAAATLGAVALPSTEAKPAEASTGDEAQADVWAQARAMQEQQPEAKPDAKPNAALYDAIERAGDVDTLRRIWAVNQATFAADAELLAAWKQRGKALTG